MIWFRARSEVDKVNRLVTLQDFKLIKRRFPSLGNNGSQYEPALQSEMPWKQTIPQRQKTYPLQNLPPVAMDLAGSAAAARRLLAGREVTAAPEHVQWHALDGFHQFDTQGMVLAVLLPAPG